MRVDYTRYQVGMGLSAKIVLTACPICEKPCDAQNRKTFSRYVHAVEIRRRLRAVGGQARSWNQLEIKEACLESAAKRRKRLGDGDAEGES